MTRTFEDIEAYRKTELNNLLPPEKKGIINRLRTSFAGKVLYAAAMVGTLAGVAEYHGATNPEPVKNVTETTTTEITNLVNTVQKFVTPEKNYQETKTGNETAVTISTQEEDLGSIIYQKKQAYTDLLKKEPNNTAAQSELKKLDMLIQVYEQTNNQKQE
jgi:hypothetical protein